MDLDALSMKFIKIFTNTRVSDLCDGIISFAASDTIINSVISRKTTPSP